MNIIPSTFRLLEIVTTETTSRQTYDKEDVLIKLLLNKYNLFTKCCVFVILAK